MDNTVAITSICVEEGQLTLCAKCTEGWLPPAALTGMTVREFEGFMGFSEQYTCWVRAAADGVSAEKYTGLLEDRERAVRAELGGSVAAATAHIESLRAQLAEAREAARGAAEAARGAAEAARGQVEEAQRVAEAAQRRAEAAIRDQLANLDAIKAKTEKTVRDNIEMMYRGVTGEKDKMIDYLKGEISRREEKIATLETAASARLRVQQNAALRGRAGEDAFEDAAGAVGWRVTRTAGESHMCDFKGVVCGLDVFFEIKNHADVIPAKELAKFRRDMEEHPEIGAGVFIGMQAPISRSSGERWSLEWTADRRPMIFIGELEKDDPVAVLRIVEKFIGVVAGIRSAGGEEDKGAAMAQLEQRIKAASGYLEAVGGKLRGLFNKMVVDKGAMEAAYMNSLMMLKTIREEHVMTVDALLGTLTFEVDGGGVGAGAGAGAEPAVTAAPAAAKKKRTTKAVAAAAGPAIIIE